MDPQKLSQLDPKLRDAYQRVMGTQLPDLQAAPASPQNEPVETQAFPPPLPPTPDLNPSPAPTIGEPPTTPIESPQPLTPEPQPAINPQPDVPPVNEPAPITPEPAIPQQQASDFAQMNSEIPAPMAANPISANFTAPSPTQPQTMAIKKKGMLTPVMTGIAIVVFVVVYTLFWTKIFNFKLPFLP